MKNLHRKISAMLLAGMVVVGGFAASGVSSFAASNRAVPNVALESEVRRMKSVCGMYGYNASLVKDDNEFNKLVGDCNKSDLYNRGNKVVVRNPYELPQHLQRAKYSGKKFVKAQYRGGLYLIEIK